MMRYLLFALGILASCSSSVTEPASPAQSAYVRALVAEDSLNAALRDLYREGGDLIYVYVVRVPGRQRTLARGQALAEKAMTAIDPRPVRRTGRPRTGN